MLSPAQGSAHVPAAFALSGVQEKHGEEEEGVKTGGPEGCAAQLLCQRAAAGAVGVHQGERGAGQLSLLPCNPLLVALPRALCPPPTALRVPACRTFLFLNLLTLSVSPASCSKEFGCLIMH